MASKGASKGRGRSGGLRFSEEEFLAMQQRVRGSTVTAEGGGLDKAISLAIHKPATKATSKDADVPFDSLDTVSSVPLASTEPAPKPKRKPRAKATTPAVLDKTADDPDWTAPRTVKVKKSGKQTINQHVQNVIQSIKLSTVKTSVSDNHLSLVFDGARLLTLNEILSLMPYQPYLVFNYKTTWRNKIDEALLIAKDNYRARMPEFTEKCFFIGFRRAMKLVDRDGLPSCFKYILDDIRNQFVLPEKILKDDNPNLIVDTPCFQAKGEHMVGVRLERVPNWAEPTMDDTVLLTQAPVATSLGLSS